MHCYHLKADVWHCFCLLAVFLYLIIYPVSWLTPLRYRMSCDSVCSSVPLSCQVNGTAVSLSSSRVAGSQKPACDCGFQPKLGYWNVTWLLLVPGSVYFWHTILANYSML